MGIRVLGTGSYTPAFQVTNEQIILENAGEIIKYTIDYLLPDSFKL